MALMLGAAPAFAQYTRAAGVNAPAMEVERRIATLQPNDALRPLI